MRSWPSHCPWKQCPLAWHWLGLQPLPARGADPEVPLLAPVAEHPAPQELGLQQALALQLMPRARKIAGPAGCPAEKGSLSLLVPAAADQVRQVARGGVQEQLRKHCSLSIGCNAEAQG